MHQPTFARVEFERDGYKTRRQKFLERLDGLVPWQRFEAAIEPHYPKPGRGRRPYPLSVMLRIHIVQLCYNLSDPGTNAENNRTEPRRLGPLSGGLGRNWNEHRMRFISHKTTDQILDNLTGYLNRISNSGH